MDYNTLIDKIKDNKECSVKNFFRLIKIGVEEILGIRINYRILSTDYLRMNNKWYVNDRILESLRFTDGYTLSTASLNKMKRNLVEVFQEKSKYFEYLVDLYKSINHHEYRYIHISLNVDFFKNIDSLEKAYWLGFLLAEGHIRIKKNSYRFMLSTSVLDGILIKKFIEAIGFDLKYINYRRAVYKRVTTRSYNIHFSNTIFCKNLIKNGFPENGQVSNNPEFRFPYWLFSDKKIVMAMLLGFFDGDGTHGFEDSRFLSKDDDSVRSPVLISPNRKFLQDIKKYFDIDNEIRSFENTFFLAIGKELFNDLIKNYDKSLERKAIGYNREDERDKFMFSKEELKTLIDKDLSYQKIADIHYDKYKVKITWATVRLWAIKWGLRN